MTRKSILLRILFFVVLTALTAAALYCGTPMRRRYSARGLHISLPAAKAEQASKIVIRWRDVHTTLLLKDGRWVVEERGSRPASVPRISALLNSLSALAPVKQLHNVDQAALRQLRLVEKDPKLVPGVRLILYDRDDRELFSILLGKGHFVRPEPGRTASGEAEGRYVLIGGKVYLIPVVFENCHPIPAVWVEPLRLYELRRALMMNSQRFENGKGRLFCETVLPADARLEKIGGPGKEFWSNGKNWEPDAAFLASAARGAKRTGRGPYMGAWRLEVAPGAPRANDRFLHVLTATDTTATCPQVERIKTDTCDGVTVAVGATKATVLFNRTGTVGGTSACGEGSVRPLATTVQPQSGLAPLD